VTTLTMVTFLVWMLVIPANWGKTSLMKTASNIAIALLSVGLAIAHAATDEHAVGWIFCAMVYGFTSGGQYWELVHKEADIDSKWAWRRWQEAEHEKIMAAFRAFRCVASVQPSSAEHDDVMNRERVRTELRAKLFEVLK
jgi:hypothetical protein